MIAAAHDLLKPHLIKAAADYKDKGILTLASPAARKFFDTEMSLGPDTGVIFTAIELAAMKADTRFLSEAFVRDAARLSFATRISLLDLARGGYNFEKIVFFAKLHGLKKLSASDREWSAMPAVKSPNRPQIGI